MSKHLLKTVVLKALDDMKANDVVELSVKDMTSMTDWMIVASGTSNRHVKSLAENVEFDAKQSGYKAIGVEGVDDGEWVLVDFGDVIVHVMQPATRSLYDLESLWSVPAT